MNAYANHLAVSPDRRKLDEVVERERQVRGFDRSAPIATGEEVAYAALDVTLATAANPSQTRASANRT
jgi:hypothetical protein